MRGRGIVPLGLVWLWIATLSGAPQSANPAPVLQTARLAGSSPEEQYRHDVWQTENGLPSNSIQAILQARRGYLWLGTPAGLVRYDGVKFTVFNRLNTPGLTDDDCRALAETADGSLWVATRGGLLRFRNQRSQRFTLSDGLLTEDIQLLRPAHDGGLWIGTPRGLHRWRDGKIASFTTRDGLADDWVVGLQEDAQGTFWVHTSWGIHLFDAARQKLVEVIERKSLTAALPSALAIGANQSLWYFGVVAMPAGDFRLGELVHFQNSRPVRFPFPRELDHVGRPGFLVPDRTGTLWCSAGRGGLYAFRDGRFTHFNSTNGLSDNWVLSFCEDREGNLWIGTESGGLNRWRRRRLNAVTVREGLADNSVWAVRESRDGSIWVGTDGGLTRLQGDHCETYTETQGLTQNLVRALCEDRDGRMWVGTGDGLCWFANGTFQRQPLPGGLGGNKVRAVCQTDDGAIWVGTAGGLHRLQEGRGVRFTTAEGLPTDDVRALLEDAEGNLWIGTLGGGLARWTGGGFHVFTVVDGLADDSAWALYQDGTGALWIGTERGLTRREGDRFFSFTTAHGLEENIINHILEDDADHLWLSGEAGIHRVSRRDLEAIAAGRLKHAVVATFGIADGMLTPETNGQKSQPAGWKTRAGELWFATAKGAVRLAPGTGVINGVPPVSVIEAVRADDEPLRSDLLSVGLVDSATQFASRSDEVEVTELPAGRGRVLEFVYSAPSFVAVERERFRYRLEGCDEGWHDVGARRVVYYNNLRPGRYVFRVMAANHHGQWGEPSPGFAIDLAPHYYQTTWFFAAAALGLAGLAYGTHRGRLTVLRRFQTLERQLAIERERARIARDIHDHLGASLTQISLVTEVAKRKLEAAHPAKVELQKLGGAGEEAMQSMDEIVWAIDPQNDTLRSLLAYLRTFAADFLESAGIQHRLVWPDEIPDVLLSAETRHHLFLVAKEALNNAIRHAAASEVNLRVTLQGGILECVISDNGSGFAPESVVGLGNGLANMRRRIERLGGSLEIASQPGAGTRVVVRLPLDAAAKNKS